MTRLLILLIAICFANAGNIHIRNLAKQAEASFNDPESKAYANINGKDYFIGTEISLDWVNAIEFCNALSGPDGGRALVSLETMEENDAIKTYLSDNGLNGVEMWTSAQRLPGGFLWSGSGQLGTFTDWAPGEPDLSQSYVCVHTSSAGWGDELCNNRQRNFICE